MHMKYFIYHTTYTYSAKYLILLTRNGSRFSERACEYGDLKQGGQAVHPPLTSF